VKVLPDENLDHRLRKNLGSHEVFTASYMGWAGLKNGKLLRAAEDDGFAVLLTGDQTLYDEQSMTARRLATNRNGHQQLRAWLVSSSRLRHVQSQKDFQQVISTVSQRRLFLQ
jgi:hypothetical protein